MLRPELRQRCVTVLLSISAAKGGVDEFVVYLVIGGSSPSSGLELYNFFKARPERTTVYNMSSVDSAGVLFFLGFQTRYGVPASSFKVHQTKFSKASLPDWYSYSDLKKSAMELLAVDQKTHRAIASETASKAETPLSVEDVEAAATRTTIYFAEDALRHGFIEEIVTPTMPIQDVSYLTEQYLAGLPD
ncbi:ATP-dependent Clp protease proteolytic subunit [Microvirga sp.]|uniref:ATP-dependent Clp protease proteolytic subunit n=1 Tax=Microvirga sp. TaxID=1873136 RepID=UPI0039198AB9